METLTKTNIISCSDCFYNNNCPVQWHKNNAACLTIQKSIPSVARQVDIDDKIDNNKCPANYFCTVATTGYTEIEREHLCYICWKRYCKENNIEVIYGSISSS